MKPRFIFSLCSMVLAAALVVGGFSLAWFTDGAISSGTPAMSAGTVDLAINDAKVNDKSDWKACRKCRHGHGGGCHKGKKGKCASKDFSWTLENTGTKKAFFRARLMETMVAEENGKPVESQVEWECTDKQSKWEFAEDSSKPGLEDGWWYYCGAAVPAGGGVDFRLTGFLPSRGDVESGKYEVRLEAEAIQASEEAIGYEWPDYPCGVD